MRRLLMRRAKSQAERRRVIVFLLQASLAMVFLLIQISLLEPVNHNPKAHRKNINLAETNKPPSLSHSTSRCPLEGTSTHDASRRIRPLSPDIVKFSERPVEHLKIHYNEAIQPWMLPTVQMAFLKKKTLAAHDGLYGIENYQSRFEGSVTQTWIAILNRLELETIHQHGGDSYMVLDAGMNTGFYTTLTAVMGYTVHAFDIQRDCFDVARLLVRANNVESRVHFYHLGLWSEPSSMIVQEGCDPGKGIDNQAERDLQKDLQWNHRPHNVTVIPINMFLDTIVMKRKIAILKMDIEGAEIAALQGLSLCNLQCIENIIMELALPRIRRVGGGSTNRVKHEYQRLEASGFVAYLLYKPILPPEEWWDEARMQQKWGVHAASPIHPILGKLIPNTTTVTNILTWKVHDWDILLKRGACATPCNLFFTRMAEQYA